MEALAAAGAFSSDYADYDHVGVAPVGLIALFAGLAGAGSTIAHSRGAGHASAIATAGRALLRFSLASSVLCVLAVQLAVLNVCENIEHLTAFGVPSDGLEWLGGPPPAALLVHALLALVFTLALRRSLGSVLATCDALFRAVVSFVFAAPPAHPRPAFSRREFRLAPASRACAIACKNGLRAPPILP
jgi:hypothetical protein